MANFPTTLPSFTNPSSSNFLNSPPHATQHGNENDEITALATKVGINGSAVTTTHDYKLSGVTGTDKAVSLTGTETLTNKTLQSPLPVVVPMAAQAINGTAGSVFTRTLAGNEVFTQSGFVAGQCFMVEVKQGSGTSYTVTWFSGITWLTTGGTAPVQTTTSNGYTTYGFRCTGTNTFLGYLVGQN